MHAHLSFGTTPTQDFRDLFVVCHAYVIYMCYECFCRRYECFYRCYECFTGAMNDFAGAMNVLQAL